MKQIQALILAVLFAAAGCSTVAATGDAVESVGDGTGHALSGASDAVGDAGQAVGEGVGDIVSGTGRAITRGADETENKGY